MTYWLTGICYFGKINNQSKVSTYPVCARCMKLIKTYLLLTCIAYTECNLLFCAVQSFSYMP